MVFSVFLRMIYPENIEQKLGFDQIREMISGECLSSLGQLYVGKMRFSDDHALVVKLIEQTSEFKNIISQGLNFPSQNFIDVAPLLQKIKPSGSFLEKEELKDIKLSLLTIFSCITFFDSKEEFPFLKELRKGIDPDKTIYKKIDKIIDDNGEIRDDASPELREIRKKLISEQSRARRELDKILRSLKREGYTDEDVSVTVRSGRMVVPVNSEFKRKVKGFIHDESATGQTTYIEPAEVLEINNEIRDLEYKEKREVVKILISIADLLRPNIDDLSKAYQFLGLIDFIRAKAKLSIKIEGVKPVIIKDTLCSFSH